MMNIKEMDHTYIAPTYSRYNIVFEKGRGALLYDDSGREYIDLGAGIAVNIFGACDEPWQKAVTEQMGKLTHVSNLYYTEPDTRLAEELCRRTGMRKAFFGNSGAEANECAIKCARKYSFDRYGAGRHTVVTLKKSFHGRTLATLAATGQDEFHQYFGPFPEGFSYAEPDDFEDVKRICESESVCAVMMEMVQGEGGVHALSPHFVKQTADYCRAHDILLIDDEVQCGNGRTGTLYAYMQYGVLPDIMTTAKGIGGGLPIGICLMGDVCMDTLSKGTHGSTFGGNPVICAGALNILDRLDERLLKETADKGRYIQEVLADTHGVVKTDGLGMMVGAELEKSADDAAAACMQQGVLVLTAHGRLRFLPPLTISFETLEKAMKIVKNVIENGVES